MLLNLLIEFSDLDLIKKSHNSFDKEGPCNTPLVPRPLKTAIDGFFGCSPSKGLLSFVVGLTPATLLTIS